MTDGRAFQPYFKSMLALGRNFQLGDLYDYRSDRIINGKHFFQRLGIWLRAPLFTLLKANSKYFTDTD